MPRGSAVRPSIVRSSSPVAAILARQFGKEQVAQVTALVNELFERDWKEKASQQKKPERAFENYTRPSRKNLH